ncbi:BolA/IbaG family iron-sulfur metabolism protein [Marinospirillum sp. MEB164]|uniref:BolA/IbaG family iron-sulfur metabolism protein n=1 Tax=Marinospirillum alkalitolerans TaxID=3123374 RepID=A0ABW8PTW8_9GAMM
MGQVQQQIQTKLEQALSPQWLTIENESDQHSGPAGRESHFKVTLVSPLFAGLLPVKRHQKVYSLLSEELAGSVHALALHLYTPQEWERAGAQRPDSPSCLGGGR